MEGFFERFWAFLIAFLITAAGIFGITIIFFPEGPEEPEPWVTPGAPDGTTEDEWIKIGILGPMTDIHGMAMYRGAYLRAWEINAAGGVWVNGSRYYVAIARQDTSESAADPDAEIAINATYELINVKGAEYIIGGYRPESVLTYMEEVLDAETMFLNVGTDDQSLLQGLNTSSPLYDYNRYKYLFRTMPHNSFLQGYDVMQYLTYLKYAIPDIADDMNSGLYQYVNSTNFNITRIAFIRENLLWTEGFAEPIIESLNATGDLEVLDISYAPSASYTNFVSYWNTVQAFDIQIAIPICSFFGSEPMMEAYADVLPHCIVAGVDDPGSEGTFWDATGGACNGEVVSTSSASLNVSYGALSNRFYGSYMGNYSISPLYTATGAYDAVGLYCIAMNETGSLEADDLIAEFESWNWLSPLLDSTAAAPRFCFMDNSLRSAMESTGYGYESLVINSHDVIGGYLGAFIWAFSSYALPRQGYYNTFFAQWQDGELLCVPGPGWDSCSYNASLAQASLRLPAHGINGLPGVVLP